MINDLTPQAAWDLIQQNPTAVLVDVRTKMEYAYVGHPIGAINIPWKDGPNWELNSRFVDDVRKIAPAADAPILLLCRSGQRSLAAARALEDAGYQYLVNITDGFEGPLDDNHHRCTLGGWRFCKLPWVQS